MANTKVSEFSRSNGVNANTHSTIFYAVDLQSQTSIAISANTLANTLFANNILYVNANIVMTNASVIQFPDGTKMNTAASGSGSNPGQSGIDASQNVRLDWANVSILATDDKMQSAYNQANSGSLTLAQEIDLLPNSGSLWLSTQSNKFVMLDLINGDIELITAKTLGKDLYNQDTLYVNTGIQMLTGGPAVPITFTDFSQQTTAFTTAIGTTITQTATDLDTLSTMAGANNTFITGRMNATNTSITVIQGTDQSQNVRLTFGNTRSTIIEGVDASQNVQITFANARMTIIEGTDTGQNARMTIIEAVNLSQNTAGIQNNNTFIFGTTTLNYKNLRVAGNTTVTGNLIVANSSITSNVRDIGGTVSSVTIDFLQDSIVRVNTSTALTVTLANPTPGKVIDLLIVNTSATACTITHGTSALNSSTGNTTYSLLGTRTAFNRYYCTNANVANVFVSTVFNTFA